MEHKFGGAWTLLKLEVLRKYLGFYTTALKKQAFKLCYIDAFAGSGEVSIPGRGKIPGSAMWALDYPFDKYVFIEKDPLYTEQLKQRIAQIASDKDTRVVCGDCNNYLKEICSGSWLSTGWRGVLFLDPYGMELHWSSLEVIAKTKAIDVWYLFPFMALNRLLRKDKDIPHKHREIIRNLIGTDDWENEIYKLSSQLSLFDDEVYEKESIDIVREYILNRLKTVFPAVSPYSRALTNKNNTTLFLLCFATSNPNGKAIGLALKAANHILKHT